MVNKENNSFGKIYHKLGESLELAILQSQKEFLNAFFAIRRTEQLPDYAFTRLTLYGCHC